jgi:hypothetical protein
MGPPVGARGTEAPYRYFDVRLHDLQFRCRGGQRPSNSHDLSVLVGLLWRMPTFGGGSYLCRHIRQ